MAVSTITDDKKKALNLAITQIEKSCGKGSIMRLGTETRVRV
jgi:recombination protein RecA